SRLGVDCQRGRGAGHRGVRSGPDRPVQAVLRFSIMLMDYAERVWRGEIGMDGLLADGSLWGVAHDLTDGVAVVAGFSNVIVFRTDAGLLLFDTGVEFAATVTHQAVRAWCA